MQQGASGSSPAGWVFFAEEPVPEQWRSRARQVWLVPLLPQEMTDMLKGSPVAPALDEAEERLARLAAAGLSIDQIARELSLTPRTVRRQLGHLRELVGVGSNVELAALLAKRGF